MIAQVEIQDLVQRHLTGKRVDIVAVVNQLLYLADTVREVHCTLADDDHLRFEIQGQGALEVPLSRARSRLRAMCARLGVLCNESGGQDVSLYGGEGVIFRDTPESSPSAPRAMDQLPMANGPVRAGGNSNSQEGRNWSVRFMNTPDNHEFTIKVR
jgi:hypothetical protein